MTIQGTFQVKEDAELSVDVAFESERPAWFEALERRWRERLPEVPGAKVYPGALGIGVEYRGVDPSLERAHVLLGWSVSVFSEVAEDEGCEIDARIMTFYKWPP